MKSGQGEGNPATPYPKLGHPLAPKNTCDFYKSDDVSRMMGGKLHVKQAEQHVYVQRRLFKDRFPKETIGFSKIAELRPRHCILLVVPTQFVLYHHQNVKLTILGVKLPDLAANSDVHLST